VGPLFLAFTLLPLIDLYFVIRIGRVVGAPSTLLFVIAMGILGAVLAKTQGRKVLRAWQEALSAGRVPEEGVLGGVLVLAGALLLITPGVISDVVGLLCLLPPTRRAIAGMLSRYLANQVARGQASVQSYGFEWPPRPPSTSPSMPPRAPFNPRQASRPPRSAEGRPFPRTGRDDIIDTEGEEV
jgi:UPF0716 protein FxsA